MTYDLDNVSHISFCEDSVLSVGETIVRRNRKFLRRKKVLLDFSYFNWFLIKNLEKVLEVVKVPPLVLKRAVYDVFPFKRNMFHLIATNTNLLKYAIERS